MKFVNRNWAQVIFGEFRPYITIRNKKDTYALIKGDMLALEGGPVPLKLFGRKTRFSVCILNNNVIVYCPIISHTNLNSKSWYIRATLARVPYTKVLALLNGTVQTRHC